tara:strand:- start:857 stop:1834 length:978 start_codon:yes stop_codon:yes gene_type:complete
MIIKYYELDKHGIDEFKFYLFYGKNEGLQNEVLINKFKNSTEDQMIKYEEKEFINNFDDILSELLNISFFEKRKKIIISRISEKINKYIDIILQKKISETIFILKSGPLDKKSKLRALFEKNKDLAIVPFYEDDNKKLSQLVSEFLIDKNIKLSRESINLLVSRANGDRKNLRIELEKIFNYSISNEKIEYDTVQKLTNLAENYSVNELADNYLIKNKKNTAKILNENNYTSEDCILILRTILNKSKRLLGILERYNKINNIDEVISNTRPPIFWKEKESVKNQVRSWKKKDLMNKIYEINEIESLIKSNSNNSVNIISDFIVNY